MDLSIIATREDEYLNNGFVDHSEKLLLIEVKKERPEDDLSQGVAYGEAVIHRNKIPKPVF